MERLFDCAICERGIVDYPWRKGTDRHIAPVCRMCEAHYSDCKPSAGAFLDRRIATQLSALANALCGKANCMDWERRYART